MHDPHCLNCQAPIAPKGNFCTNCGQNAHLHRLSIGHIIHDGLHFFLHADKSIFVLLKSLATKTGTVGREFIAGKRQKYFPPLNFFLIVAGLIVLSISLFKPLKKDTDDVNRQLTAMVEQLPDPVQKKRLLGIIKRQNDVSNFTKKYGNILPMLALPLISFVFYLFFRRSGYNYAEHLVGNLYAIGFTGLVFTLLFIPISSFTSVKAYFILLGVFFVFEITYRTIYYVHFMNQKKAVAIKALGASLVAQLIWISLASSVLFWYIKSGISGLFA